MEKSKSIQAWIIKSIPLSDITCLHSFPEPIGTLGSSTMCKRIGHAVAR